MPSQYFYILFHHHLKTKITLPFFMIFITTIGIAQVRKQMQGKIAVPNASAADVLILNLNTEEEVKSNADGSFLIFAKTGDILDFASPNFDYKQLVIDQSVYDQNDLTVFLNAKLIFLDEVEIKSYNAVGLGVLQKLAKSYTPLERRLKTAGDFKPIHLLGLLGGSLQLDPIFNAINGKTKRLKKEIKLERLQKRLSLFQSFFPKEILINQLNINSDEVIEFAYFVLDKPEFITLLEARDSGKMLFYLMQKQVQFENQKQSNEKK
jgi:hypothetical protein